jgi:hypothetical protein
LSAGADEADRRYRLPRSGGSRRLPTSNFMSSGLGLPSDFYQKRSKAMKTFALSVVITSALVGQALAWGQEGHSIVAEIAQQRLKEPAAKKVQQLLKGRSLASVASWADDVRPERPETSNWHFADIPLHSEKYSEARDCKPNAKGDCVVKELMRLKNDLRCTTGDAQAEALKFAVHFVGDIHQPLHTVDDMTGGNELQVEIFMRGMTTCTTRAHASPCACQRISMPPGTVASSTKRLGIGAPMLRAWRVAG